MRGDKPSRISRLSLSSSFYPFHRFYPFTLYRLTTQPPNFELIGMRVEQCGRDGARPSLTLRLRASA